MRPLVSAIVVTFEHARYIDGALRSALAQPEVGEVIVADDGSSDDTVARAKAVDDPRIRVVELPHRGLVGLAATYTEASRFAAGEFLALLEGDDLWPVGKIAAQLRHFSHPDVVLSHGPYSVIGARGTLLRARVEPPHSLPLGPYDALPLHLVSSYVMAVTAVIRRSAVEAIGGFHQLPGTPHWDYPTFLRLAEVGRFAYTAEVVGIWRKRGDSATMRIAGSDLEGAGFAQEEALAALARAVGRGPLPSRGAIRRAWADAAARNLLQIARVLNARGCLRQSIVLCARGSAQAASVPVRLRCALLALAFAARIDVERIAARGARSHLDELA